MYFDGSLNLDGARAGIYFISPSGDKLCYVLCLYFRASNNTAEYKVALHGLCIAVKLDVKRLQVYGDSALVINQLNKDWNCTNDKIDAYYAVIRKLEDKFYGIEYHHVVQANNQAADELSKLGLTWAEVPTEVFVQDLVMPSIKQGQEGVEEKPPAEQLVATVPSSSSDWRELFIKYLTTTDVSADNIERERLTRHNKHYVLVEGKLYSKNTKGEIL